MSDKKTIIELEKRESELEKQLSDIEAEVYRIVSCWPMIIIDSIIPFSSLKCFAYAIDAPQDKVDLIERIKRTDRGEIIFLKGKKAAVKFEDYFSDDEIDSMRKI